MAGGLDIQEEKRKNLKLAEKALAETRDYLQDIEKRMLRGEEIDQKTIDRMTAIVARLEALTK